VDYKGILSLRISYGTFLKGEMTTLLALFRNFLVDVLSDPIAIATLLS
jgi:hypothetical protein